MVQVAQLLTFCPPGPRAPGKPAEPLSPGSPLAPCKHSPRSALGRRESFGQCRATHCQDTQHCARGMDAHGAQECSWVPLAAANHEPPHSPALLSRPVPSLRAFPAPPSLLCPLQCPLGHGLPAKGRTEGWDQGLLGWGGESSYPGRDMGVYGVDVPPEAGSPSRPPALTGSPLLPLAPAGPSTTTVSPCMQERGGCEPGGDSTATLPPQPWGLTLSPLGPTAPTSPCKEGTVRCHEGGNTPLPGSPAPKEVPYLVPTLSSVPRQALWERGESCLGEGQLMGWRAEWYVPLARGHLPALGAHLHPASRRGGVRGGSGGHPSWWGHGSAMVVWAGGFVVLCTRGPGSPRSPLAPGSPAPGSPCGGNTRVCSPQQLTSAGSSSRGPNCVPPPCQGTSHAPCTAPGAQSRLPGAITQSGLSISQEGAAAPHKRSSPTSLCHRAVLSPTLSPFSPEAPCMP